MKKIALLAAAVLVGTSAYSQTTTTTGTGTKFGLKVGVNLPKYSTHVSDGKNPETSRATNFHVTGYTDISLGAPFSIQPGISLQGKGGEFFDDDVTEIKESTLWLEVPVNLVAKLPLGTSGTNFFVGAGPYVAYGISGRRETKFKDDTPANDEGDRFISDVKFGKDSDSNLKALDMGFNFLGGFQLSNGFNVGAGYGLGINDLRPQGNGGEGKLTNRVLSFSVGYAF